MEELLNKLIEKGWKPFGFEAKEYKISIFNIRSITLHLYHTKHPTQEWIGYSIRNITSKESGLWQFVCENGMIKTNGCCNGWVYHDEYDDYNNGTGIYDEEMLPRYYDTEYQYRLIESSLKDESELEGFLFNAIKLD